MYYETYLYLIQNYNFVKYTIIITKVDRFFFRGTKLNLYQYPRSHFIMHWSSISPTPLSFFAPRLHLESCVSHLWNLSLFIYVISYTHINFMSSFILIFSLIFFILHIERMSLHSVLSMVLSLLGHCQMIIFTSYSGIILFLQVMIVTGKNSGIIPGDILHGNLIETPLLVRWPLIFLRPSDSCQVYFS